LPCSHDGTSSDLGGRTTTNATGVGVLLRREHGPNLGRQGVISQGGRPFFRGRFHVATSGLPWDGMCSLAKREEIFSSLADLIRRTRSLRGTFLLILLEGREEITKGGRAAGWEFPKKKPLSQRGRGAPLPPHLTGACPSRGERTLMGRERGPQKILSKKKRATLNGPTADSGEDGDDGGKREGFTHERSRRKRASRLRGGTFFPWVKSDY